MRHTIIVTRDRLNYHTYSSLKKACDAEGWKYQTLRNYRFPFRHQGAEVIKAVLN